MPSKSTSKQGIAGDGVLFGLELTDKTTTTTKAGKSNKACCDSKDKKDTSEESEIGFRAMVRESLTVGHIVEIRKKRSDDSMFSGVSLAGCCSCCKNDSAEATATGKGYTSTVFSATDIDYTELVESRTELAGAAAVGGCCMSKLACLCCKSGDDDAKVTHRSKDLLIHLRNKSTPISIKWEDIMGQRKDVPETCCCPGQRTKYTDSETTETDGTQISVSTGEEWNTDSKCWQCWHPIELLLCFCCAADGTEETRTSKLITQKYYMDEGIQSRYHFDTEGEVMSSLTHVLLAAMTANRHGGSDKHTVIAQPTLSGKASRSSKKATKPKAGKEDAGYGFEETE